MIITMIVMIIIVVVVFFFCFFFFFFFRSLPSSSFILPCLSSLSFLRLALGCGIFPRFLHVLQPVLVPGWGILHVFSTVSCHFQVLTCRFCAQQLPQAPATAALPLHSRPSPPALSQPCRLHLPTSLPSVQSPRSYPPPASTQTNLYTNQLLCKHSFKPSTFCGNPLLHRPAFAQTRSYTTRFSTNHLLHQPAFTSTTQLLHAPLFRQTNLLHQPALHNPCFGPVGQRSEDWRNAEGC